MYIINMFHVILYIKIYFAQIRLGIVIVVNRRCDVSNAISSEISMGRKLARVENCIGNYTYSAKYETTRFFSNAQAAKWNSLFEKDNKDTSA